MNFLYKKLAYRVMRARPLRLAQRRSTDNPMVQSLLQDGIAIANWRDVFNESPESSHLFLRLDAEAQAFRSAVLSHNPDDWKSGYLKRRYKAGEMIESTSPLFALLSDQNLRKVLHAFFGSRYRALAADYWHSVPSDLPPMGSQCWHTDPEDTVMCKLFVYFSDVDAEAGATEYILGSQVGGDRRLRRFETKGTSGRYYSETEMATVFKEGAQIINASGSRGSLVFINTTGIHRGGRGAKDRLMANLTFVSPWCPLHARWAS